MKDITGVPQTCPIIDKVIKLVNQDIEGNQGEILDLLEKIRNANGSLRDFAINYAEEKESEISNLTDEICSLEETIQSLEDTISNLQDDISNLQDEIYEVDSLQKGKI